MKSILAVSGLALVISAHAAPTGPDPHEQARQSILGVVQHAASIRISTASLALAPTDPHELARQRIVAAPETGVAVRPTRATGASPTIDPHQRARHSILGNSGDSGG